MFLKIKEKKKIKGKNQIYIRIGQDYKKQVINTKWIRADYK